MKNPILVTLCVLLSITTCYSQVNLQAYGSFIRNLNRENRTNTFGGGIRFEFAKKESSFTKYVGLAYALPLYHTEQLEAHAYDSWTSPSFVNVTARYTRPMVRLEAGANCYLIGDGEISEAFNWYINGGLEAIYIGNKVDYSYYDEQKYNLGYTKDSDVNPDGSEKYGLNLHIDFGTGIEKKLGFGNLFLQAAISLPSPVQSQSDGAVFVDSFVPIPLNVNVGYKIPLSKN